MSQMKRKKLYLIDGHAQIFRAYFAPASFRNRNQGAGAVYIFARMLVRLIERGKPDAIVCALDSRGEVTVRTSIFPEYKANRDPMPEDLAEQMPVIKDVVTAMGIPIIEGGDHEADDVIGTLAHQAAAQGYEVRIVSRDKDLKQLLSDHVSLYDVDDGFCYGPDELEIDLGIRPNQFIDYLTLMGDTSDNIPGAYGVGPKRAQSLIQEYGNLEEVLKNAESVKQKKLSENLVAFRKQAPISKQLATIICDMPLNFDLKDAAFTGLNKETILPVFRKLSFNRLIDELGWGGGESSPKPETAADSEASKSAKPKPKPAAGQSLFSALPNLNVVADAKPASAEPPLPRSRGSYRLINSAQGLTELSTQLAGVTRLSVDTETTGVEALSADLVGISLSWEVGSAVYIAVKAPTGEPVCPWPEVVAVLKPVLESLKVKKVGQNLKFDMLILRRHGIVLRNVAFDTMIAAYLTDNSRQQVGMNQLAMELLNYECIPITALIGGDKKSQITMDQVPSAQVAEYAGEDADVALRLAQVLEAEVVAGGLEKLAYGLEMPLVEVLADMEFAGIKVDVPYLKTLSKEFKTRIDEVQKACWELAGSEFTINSPQQLATILFDQIGLSAGAKTSKGARSTAVDVLETLAHLHPLPKLVLEYRHLTKLRSTYIEALPKLVDDHGRVHTSFRQAVSTGRLASVDPNVQNIPVRTEEGRKIRRAFIAAENQALVVADYSQIELRILAHICEDEALVDAFRQNQDIHRRVASEVYGVEEADVTHDQRAAAKTIHFGILYGQSGHGLAQMLGISRTEAQSYIKQYFARFPRVQELQEQVHQQVQQQGFVTTLLGRRRRIDGAQDRNRARQSAALRQAFNTVIQGSAADLIKTSMLHVHRRIRDEGLPYQLLIQVHDELILEAPAGQAEAARDFLVAEMRNAMALSVPLVVDAGVGSNWLEAKA